MWSWKGTLPWPHIPKCGRERWAIFFPLAPKPFFISLQHFGTRYHFGTHSLRLPFSLLLSLSPPPLSSLSPTTAASLLPLSNHRRRPRLALSPPSPRPRRRPRLRPLSSLSSALASRPLSGKIHSSLPLASLSIASLSPYQEVAESFTPLLPLPLLLPPLQDNTLRFFFLLFAVHFGDKLIGFL